MVYRAVSGGLRLAGMSLAMLVCVFAIYAEGLRSPVFAVEDAWFYHENAERTFPWLLKQYCAVHRGWYRPTQYYLSYQLVSQFVAWDNYLGFKIVNFTLWAFLGACLWRFTDALFPGARWAGFLAALFFVGHPAIHTSAFEAVQFDALHMVFALWTVLLYFRYRTEGGRRTHYWGAFASFAAALTCKEPAVLLPFALALVNWVYAGARAAGEGARRRCAAAFGGIPHFWLLLSLYGAVRFYGLFLHPAHLKPEGVYPTIPVPDLILRNAREAPLWVSRIFTRDDYATCLRDYTVGFGVAVLALVLWLSLARGKEEAPLPRRSVYFLWGWIALFSTMPIYSGHLPRHHALAILGYSVLAGAAAAGALERFLGRGALLGSGAACVCMFLVGLGYFDFRSYLRAALSHGTPIAMNASLMREKPVDPARVAQSAFILIDDAPGFGGNQYGAGYLFKFVYQRPRLWECLFQEAGERTLREWLETPGRIGLRWEPARMRFVEVTHDLSRRAAERLAGKR